MSPALKVLNTVAQKYLTALESSSLGGYLLRFSIEERAIHENYEMSYRAEPDKNAENVRDVWVQSKYYPDQSQKLRKSLEKCTLQRWSKEALNANRKEVVEIKKEDENYLNNWKGRKFYFVQSYQMSKL